MKPYILSLALILSLVASRADAQRNLTDIPVPDPEEERKTFQVAEGFEVNLFAADPLLAKPIQMNFDPTGRLWVASSETYPQIEPGKAANDKIIILEDTDEDGRADKTRVFADGLLIPTGIEPGDGGCYVGASTELLHLRDSDGDGKADQRRVLLSGFGTEDTHHIIHTLRWGPDGCLYFAQSIYIHSHIETPYGPRRLDGGGIWQYRPETQQLEVYSKGWVNPWGFHFDQWGQSFVTDGAGGEGINYAFPGAVFPTSPGARRVLHGMNPGSPKFCGLEIITGRQLPDDCQGELITHDFRGHRVCRFRLSEDGSGYSSRELPELIKTNHVAFRPVDVKMGPDGAIYIADWYNPIIQHGEVDFRDPRRDHTHGRIWRVTYKGKPVLKRPNLVEATVKELVDSLQSPEMWTRQQARRVMKDRDRQEVVEALGQQPKTIRGDFPPKTMGWLDLLWAYQTINEPNLGLVDILISSSDYRLRSAALRALRDWKSHPLATTNQMPRMARLLYDEHPRVRLEAINVIAARQEPAEILSSLAILEKPIDENLDFALWSLFTSARDRWEPELAKNLKLITKVNQARFLATVAESPSLLSSLLPMLREQRLSLSDRLELAEVLGQHGSPSDIFESLKIVAENAGVAPQKAGAAIRSLVAMAVSRKLKPQGNLEFLERLLANPEEDVSSAAALAVGTWQVESCRPRLIDVCKQPTTATAVRLAAIDGLASLGGPGTIETLRTIAGGEYDAGAKVQAVAALVRVDPTIAASTTVKLLSTADNQLDPTHVITAFVERQGAAAALVKSLKEAKLPTDVAKRAVRVANSSAQPNPELVAALRTAGGISADAWNLSPEQMQTLLKDIVSRGDATRGEAIYRRKDTACLKCHAIGGAGGQVGPDISSIGGSAQLDYLVESIIEPSKKIKENYNSAVVQTDDGRVLTGVVVRQTDKDLILRNAEDQEIAVPLKSIEERANGLSLMPVGLADSLTRDELIDVVAFMSQLGKVGGNYMLSKSKLVRRWQVLDNTPQASERLRRDRVAAAATNDAGLTWSPAYCTVAGSLPLEGLPTFGAKWEGLVTLPSVTLVRCELQVTTPGETKLALNSASGLSLWVDGRPIEVAEQIPLTLSPGRHRLTWAVDREKRKEDLRVEVVDVAGSAANVQVVGGK